MNISLECGQETDGRWIAEVPDLPGVMAYGASRDEAARRALALRCVADWVEHGEMSAETGSVSSNLSAEHAGVAQGTPFIIARDDGEPLVKVTALAARQDEPSLGRRRCGFLKGRIKVPDDFDRMYEKEIAEMFGVNE